MNTGNKFIPKRILPDRFDLILESFQIRELFELNSPQDFKVFINELKDWASLRSHYIAKNDLMINEQKIEDLPFFMIEIILRDRDERKLIMRHLTKFDLFEFLARLDLELDWNEISHEMELKGVP
jgi:hypothetical protein